MKTISELNSKWWYRGLKVVYILSLILVCIGVGGSVYLGFADVRNLVINCDNGKIIIKKDLYLSDKEGYDTYRECSEADYWISQSDYNEKTLSKEDQLELEKILEDVIQKNPSGKEIRTYIDNYKETHGKPTFDPLKYGAIPVEDFFEGTDISNGFVRRDDGVFVPSNFKTSFEKRFSLISLIGFILMAIIITVVVFEMARRVFYYVVTGKLKPAKQ